MHVVHCSDMCWTGVEVRGVDINVIDVAILGFVDEGRVCSLQMD